MTFALFQSCRHGRRMDECPFCNRTRFVHHSETSEAGRPGRKTAAQMREQVYRAIAGAPMGLTDEEIVMVTGLGPNTARPRRVELATAGRIVPAGTRRTRSGRSAQVWAVAKAAA